MRNNWFLGHETSDWWEIRGTPKTDQSFIESLLTIGDSVVLVRTALDFSRNLSQNPQRITSQDVQRIHTMLQMVTWKPQPMRRPETYRHTVGLRCSRTWRKLSC